MNYLIVTFYKIVSFFSRIKKTVIISNSNVNEEHIKTFKLPEYYIENQEQFNVFRFGNKNISHSGCGIIAVYNALKALNYPLSNSDFVKIISLFEKKGTPLFASIGISPTAIFKFFSKRNFAVNKIISSDENKITEFSRDFDTFICLIYNNSKNLKKGLHYVCVNKIKNKSSEILFESHNPNLKSHKLYSTICKINNNKAKPLYIIGINQL